MHIGNRSSPVMLLFSWQGLKTLHGPSAAVVYTSVKGNFHRVPAELKVLGEGVEHRDQLHDDLKFACILSAP